jgi:hypothetical protein
MAAALAARQQQQMGGRGGMMNRGGGMMNRGGGNNMMNRGGGNNMMNRGGGNNMMQQAIAQRNAGNNRRTHTMGHPHEMMNHQRNRTSMTFQPQVTIFNFFSVFFLSVVLGCSGSEISKKKKVRAPLI